MIEITPSTARHSAADEVLVGDPDGVEHGLDVGPPMVEEPVEDRKARSDVRP